MSKKEFNIEVNDVKLACLRWGDGNEISIIYMISLYLIYLILYKKYE
jgi:hypothetical protein